MWNDGYSEILTICRPDKHQLVSPQNLSPSANAGHTDPPQHEKESQPQPLKRYS